MFFFIEWIYITREYVVSTKIFLNTYYLYIYIPKLFYMVSRNTTMVWVLFVKIGQWFGSDIENVGPSILFYILLYTRPMNMMKE